MAAQNVPGRGSDDLIFSAGFEAMDDAPVPFARRVIERLTYGSTPDELVRFESGGSDDSSRLAAWLDAQLSPESIDDSVCEQRLASAGYTTLDKSQAQLWSDHIRGSESRRLPVSETEAARVLRSVCSRRQLYEMCVEFWHDHFSIYGWDFTIQGLFSAHDREVVRAHALGNFRVMLEAVAASPSMLFYLDNRSSRAGEYNENFARELLELHTMGVEAYYPTINPFDVPSDANGPLGYCDNDVYEAARAFTGWTVADGHWQFPDQPEYDSGEFLYFAGWHDASSKFFLQEFVPPSQPALADGRRVLDLLAQHRATARHVCRKLAVRFIADDPPQSLIESAADLFQAQWQAPDQIAQVLRHLLESPEAFDGASGKRRRPYEMIMAMLRKTGAVVVPTDLSNWEPWGEFFNRLRQTGHGPFRWPTPDGFPDVGESWSSTSVLGQTWRLLTRLPQLDDSTGQLILPVLDTTRAALPVGDRTPANLVDFWIDRVLGYRPAGSRRRDLVDFMRQNGSSSQPLDLDSDPPFGSWSGGDLSQHYNGARLNAMVSLIFTLPEAMQR